MNPDTLHVSSRPGPRAARAQDEEPDRSRRRRLRWPLHWAAVLKLRILFKKSPTCSAPCVSCCLVCPTHSHGTVEPSLPAHLHSTRCRHPHLKPSSDPATRSQRERCPFADRLETRLPPPPRHTAVDLHGDEAQARLDLLALQRQSTQSTK